MAFQGSVGTNAQGSNFWDVGRDLTVNIGQINQTSGAGATQSPMYITSSLVQPNLSHKLIPLSSRIFTGRKDCLDQLEQYFGLELDQPQRRKHFLLYGLGGTGKSQICLKFVERNADRFWRIFWIDATSTDTIKLSFQGIASDPEARASGVDASVESTIRWLSRIKWEWLLVFDNADCAPEAVAEFIPSGDRGNILFTSRNPDMRRNAPEALALIDKMEEGDAILLLLKAAFLDGSSEELTQAKLIVMELCCLPLAVDQAGASIASGLCTIDAYLQMYSKNRQKLLADHSFKGASDYGRAVYGTWDLSFRAIEAMVNTASDSMDAQAAESAISILQSFAFFHHDNILEEMFERAAKAPVSDHVDPTDNPVQMTPYHPRQLLLPDEEGSWNYFAFRTGIRLLQSFSLINIGAYNNSYSVHPLVHCWGRDRMSQADRQTMRRAAGTLLSSSITFQFSSVNYAFRRALVPHVKAYYEHIMEKCSLKYYKEKEYVKFGLVLYESGHWKEAEQLQVQVTEMRKKVLGLEHPSTLTSIGSLALTYQNLGQWKEAESLDVQVMETRKRTFGWEHPSTLMSIGNLALTYQNQGRWKEAEELNVQVMETRKRVLGAEHPDTLTSIGNLASTYWNQSRWKERSLMFK